MAFLTVGGVTVPVALSGASLKWVETADSAPAVDGSNRKTVLGRKRQMTVPTAAMSTTDAAALRAVLQLASTSADGDWIGASITVFPTLTAETPIKVSGTHCVQMQFTLDEE